MNFQFSKKQISLSVLIIFIFVGLFIFLASWSEPLDYLRRIVGAGGAYGPLAYMLLSFLSVVLAPLTVVPLIPVASAIFGPFEAGLYSVIGWGFGGLAAFGIARRFGRPILARFISLESIDRFEKYIPEKAEFWSILLLRMIIPVDGLSYALGLLSGVDFSKYAAATFIGITPMAFVIAYAGGALIYGDIMSLLLFTLGGLVLFAVILYLYYRNRLSQKEDDDNER